MIKTNKTNNIKAVIRGLVLVWSIIFYLAFMMIVYPVMSLYVAEKYFDGNPFVYFFLFFIWWSVALSVMFYNNLTDSNREIEKPS